MSTFPNSPRLQKGALVGLDPANPLASIIVFQYNPDTLTRTLTAPTSGDRRLGMTPVNIELHIEELVLHGFAPGDRYRIGEAVQRELARLFAEQGVPPSLVGGGEVAHLDGGSFAIE